MLFSVCLGVLTKVRAVFKYVPCRGGVGQGVVDCGMGLTDGWLGCGVKGWGVGGMGASFSHSSTGSVRIVSLLRFLFAASWFGAGC